MKMASSCPADLVLPWAEAFWQQQGTLPVFASVVIDATNVTSPATARAQGFLWPVFGHCVLDSELLVTILVGFTLGSCIVAALSVDQATALIGSTTIQCAAESAAPEAKRGRVTQWDHQNKTGLPSYRRLADLGTTIQVQV